MPSAGIVVYATNDGVIEMSQHWPCSHGGDGIAADREHLPRPPGDAAKRVG